MKLTFLLIDKTNIEVMSSMLSRFLKTLAYLVFSPCRLICFDKFGRAVKMVMHNTCWVCTNVLRVGNLLNVNVLKLGLVINDALRDVKQNK